MRTLAVERGMEAYDEALESIVHRAAVKIINCVARWYDQVSLWATGVES